MKTPHYAFKERKPEKANILSKYKYVFYTLTHSDCLYKRALETELQLTAFGVKSDFPSKINALSSEGNSFDALSAIEGSGTGCCLQH